MFIPPKLTPTRTPVFYNSNFIAHRDRELNVEYCDAMYKNGKFRNLVHSGQLGNENMNERFSRFASGRGHLAIPRAYIRVTLLFNMWNEMIYDFYNNEDSPQRDKLKAECKFSDELWEDMKNLINECRQWQTIKQICDKFGYCHLMVQKQEFETLMYKNAVLDQLEFVKDEKNDVNKFTPQLIMHVMHFFNKNNVNIGPIDKKWVAQVSSSLFDDKMDKAIVLKLILNTGRHPPQNYFDNVFNQQ